MTFVHDALIFFVNSTLLIGWISYLTQLEILLLSYILVATLIVFGVSIKKQPKSLEDYCKEKMKIRNIERRGISHEKRSYSLRECLVCLDGVFYGVNEEDTRLELSQDEEKLLENMVLLECKKELCREIALSIDQDKLNTVIRSASERISHSRSNYSTFEPIN